MKSYHFVLEMILVLKICRVKFRELRINVLSPRTVGFNDVQKNNFRGHGSGDKLTKPFR